MIVNSWIHPLNVDMQTLLLFGSPQKEPCGFRIIELLKSMSRSVFGEGRMVGKDIGVVLLEMFFKL